MSVGLPLKGDTFGPSLICGFGFLAVSSVAGFGMNRRGMRNPFKFPLPRLIHRLTFARQQPAGPGCNHLLVWKTRSRRQRTQSDLPPRRRGFPVRRLPGANRAFPCFLARLPRQPGTRNVRSLMAGRVRPTGLALPSRRVPGRRANSGCDFRRFFWRTTGRCLPWTRKRRRASTTGCRRGRPRPAEGGWGNCRKVTGLNGCS